LDADSFLPLNQLLSRPFLVLLAKIFLVSKKTSKIAKSPNTETPPVLVLTETLLLVRSPGRSMDLLWLLKRCYALPTFMNPERKMEALQVWLSISHNFTYGEKCPESFRLHNASQCKPEQVPHGFGKRCIGFVGNFRH